MLSRIRPLNFTFRVVTINVRGLSRKKFELITDFFHTSQLDFCFIQDTMISLESKIAPFSASWSGPGFWATAVGTRGGVAIRLRREKIFLAVDSGILFSRILGLLLMATFIAVIRLLIRWVRLL